MLLTMTGDNRRAGDLSDEGEVIHGVASTTRANDPAVIGACNGILDEAKAMSLENPVLAMSDGNGEIWVVDDGRGNLKPGDLLISSDVAGCAMLDDPKRFPTGHIVARVAQGLDWSRVEVGPDGARRAKVAVLFDRFTRTAPDSGLQAELESLRAELKELRAALGR